MPRKNQSTSDVPVATDALAWLGSRWTAAKTSRRVCALLGVMLLVALPIWAGGGGLKDDLVKYNKLPLSESAQLYPADDAFNEAFAGFRFTCERQADHVPEETPAARHALDRFMSASEVPIPSDEDVQKRRNLLSEAIQAGSWRAGFVEAMWGVWLERNNEVGRKHFEVLWDLAADGNPAALHAVLKWSGDMRDDPARRVEILKAAIDRGNPQAMTRVGHSLGTRTRHLRALGIQMLECAAAQGDGNAYEGMARIAWLEGRWVDAQRLWVRGANLDCDRCLGHFEAYASRSLDDSPEAERDPYRVRAKALRDFFASQHVYKMSDLIELRKPAPSNLQIQVTDEEVVEFIKAQIRRYGLP